MARASFASLVFFLHVVLVFPSSSCFGLRTSKHSKKHHEVAFFIFGDSYLDAGNNNYINTSTLDQANFSPYGEAYFKFPTGRFSDGRLMSDFIGGLEFQIFDYVVPNWLYKSTFAQYAHLPLIPPFLQPGFRHYSSGANFASSGAGALVETFQGSVIDLKTQLRNYKKVETWFRHKLGDVEAKMRLSRAVYLFSIGTNDYMSPFLTDSPIFKSHSHSQYIRMVLGNLTTTIQEIYAGGGRKFGFINLPTLGCFPGLRIIKAENNGSCLEEVSSLAKLHNQALSQVLEKLGNQLKGFKYSLYDLNYNLRQRTIHPSKYGFKEGKSACCGTGQFRGVFSCGGKRIVKEFELCENPNEYVYWDSFHLTEKVYKQLAHQMWTGKVVSSMAMGLYNLKDLFRDL